MDIVSFLVDAPAHIGSGLEDGWKHAPVESGDDDVDVEFDTEPHAKEGATLPFLFIIGKETCEEQGLTWLAE